MKPKNLLTILNVLLSLSISFAQIGSKMNTGNLVGTWTNNDMGFAMTLMLQSDGTGEFDGEALTYVIKDNQLTISAGEISTIYHYKLTENTLTLSDGDLPSPVSFTRNGMTTSPAVTTAPTAGNTSPLNEQPDIIGTWSGNGEEIEFAANGQCRYLGQSFPYTAQAGNVTLTTAQGNVMFTYKVAGDQLTLSANGKNVTYSRGKGNAAPTNASPGQGKVAPELVGQWCWIDANSYKPGYEFFQSLHHA
jgi:lipopolysaccharide export system protein LptA